MANDREKAMNKSLKAAKGEPDTGTGADSSP